MNWLDERSGARRERLVVKVLRLLHKPRPAYEMFVDRDGGGPWFSMILFPEYKDWDAYALIRVLKRLILDIGEVAQRRDDKRFSRMCEQIVTLLDIAAQTEPLEGELRDGKLQ